jgi:hypothetical protein
MSPKNPVSPPSLTEQVGGMLWRGIATAGREAIMGPAKQAYQARLDALIPYEIKHKLTEMEQEKLLQAAWDAVEATMSQIPTAIQNAKR